MEDGRFDTLSRHIGGEGSRRGMLRVGLGALAAAAFGALTLGGSEETEANKARAHRKKSRKQKVRDQKKKKAKQGPPGPAGPPGPPGTPAPVVTCSGARPITCGDGCCPTTVPVCCDDLEATSGKSCNEAGQVCCPLGLGGGSCPVGAPCCPPFKGQVFGDCAFDDEKCCPPDSGSVCKTDEDCCPPATTNFDNGGCCLLDEVCCNDTTDCPDTFACSDNGCCKP